MYGPSLIGEAAPFPNGTLGNARHEADMETWMIDREEIDARIAKDVKALESAIAVVSLPDSHNESEPAKFFLWLQNGGLDSMEAYATVLYEGQWMESNPRSTAPGIMTNYTQDLLFSMERLSQNPYPLKLVHPAEELPFQIADEVATEIAGATLEELKSTGLLFYVDREFLTTTG